jgi:hypothetical protein
MFDSVYAELPEELRRQRDTWATHSLGQFPEQANLNSNHQQA